MGRVTAAMENKNRRSRRRTMSAVIAVEDIKPIVDVDLGGTNSVVATLLSMSGSMVGERSPVLHGRWRGGIHPLGGSERWDTPT
jgi:hypothetical protein